MNCLWRPCNSASPEAAVHFPITPPHGHPSTTRVHSQAQAQRESEREHESTPRPTDTPFDCTVNKPSWTAARIHANRASLQARIAIRASTSCRLPAVCVRPSVECVYNSPPAAGWITFTTPPAPTIVRVRVVSDSPAIRKSHRIAFNTVRFQCARRVYCIRIVVANNYAR